MAAVALMVACTSGPTTAPPATTPPAASPAIPAPSPTPPPDRMAFRLAARSRPFVSPIVPDNRPNPVEGDVNGRMPASDLVGVATDCVAARAAAPSLGLLLATARDEGVALGTVQCYRPLSDQVAVKKAWTAKGHSACAAPVLTNSSGKPVGTSMHGWGKATDFGDGNKTLTFGSPGYQWLTDHAAQFGWNHPAWAQPGGSVCPEPWHWEWVGDGGALHDSRVKADTVTVVPSTDGLGYWMVTGLGAVRAYGDATDKGSLAHRTLPWLISAACRTPDGNGYWLVEGDGTVHAFGDARSHGSAAIGPLSQPIVGMAASPDGGGYWLVAADGRVYAFGTAASYGSLQASHVHLARPIVAIVSTPDGKGYWLAGADGKVFAYGDAALHGDAHRRDLRAPVVSMAATRDGGGYWLARSDGKLYAFGDARDLGSAPRKKLHEPVTSIAAAPGGGGYWLVAADGSIFAFGDADLFHPAPRERA
jgi:LAS superfamily LD-carboxypeptidase LdcB